MSVANANTITKGASDEWSILRAWLRDWLRYCRWSYLTIMSPDVLIEAVKVKAPVVNVNVQVTRTEPDLVPFGLLWKIYD